MIDTQSQFTACKVKYDGAFALDIDQAVTEELCGAYLDRSGVCHCIII